MAVSNNKKEISMMVCTGGSWEVANGGLEYKPLGLARRVLHCSSGLTFNNFKKKVARKLNLSSVSGFRMSYYDKDEQVVMGIGDDEDYDVFKEWATKNSDGVLLTIYVVELLPKRRLKWYWKVVLLWSLLCFVFNINN